ncbi:hypothetical protein BDP55DRAFT_665436 [Colletotrichum godetiae]|uniref:Uncharacterized protein n=1 Tax=Colletotrichum godetiae TaxID=1209918 RepID=A0AAJ0EX68_9PEZI|nr:uncharacterized protein BDP55DRAFT_665436 [Colletotrichum godetiae]KAK1674950.1 hypothetical protein BDP55DRAFT_665436 [Colletotrichum godetiae]
MSCNIFPKVEELACEKSILYLVKDSAAMPLNIAPSLAIRGMRMPVSVQWNIAPRLSHILPTKHLLLEGDLGEFPTQEGEGLESYSDITFNKVHMSEIKIIDFSSAKLSALRYIGEDCHLFGPAWMDPLPGILSNLQSSRAESLETLCLAFSRPTLGYTGGPKLPSLGGLTKLKNLWIELGSPGENWSLPRWDFAKVMVFWLKDSPRQTIRCETITRQM